MACVHNQAKINALNAEIHSKEQQIKGLNSNIDKCKKIKEKHQNFNDKIGCVISNLEGNTVVDGQSYDNGKMTECLTKSNDTIKDCDDIIALSDEKIISLNNEIDNLKSKIDSLQGDCSSCQISWSTYSN